MEAQTTGRKVRPLSIAEYTAALARNGSRILPGAQGTFWLQYEFLSMMRIPIFQLAPPAPEEVRRILWSGWVGLVNYVLEPGEYYPANAWLYICSDRAYALDKLPPAVRRNVRRGLKELKVATVTSDELLRHGAQAFCDTRQRVGLSDGTVERFKRRFSARARSPGHVFLGAWKDDHLAAFLSITEVDDWAEIEGCFSMSSLLGLRPNDTLIFSALSHYLVKKKCRLVSYGLSSMQANSNAAGLHAFKTKLGFEAKSVHRVFVLHPFLRPFANQLTLWGVNTTLRFSPGSRMLKKASGILTSMLVTQQRFVKLLNKKRFVSNGPHLDPCL